MFDRKITDWAIDFVTRSKHEGKPFYVYLPYTQVHIPPISDPEYAGRTKRGNFADLLVQMDDFTGRILDTLDDLGLAEDTIVIWSSDNGADPNYRAPAMDPDPLGGQWSGFSGPWRGGYFTSLEGSNRAPCLIRWPGKVPAGKVSNELVHLADTFTTLLLAAGAKVPDDRQIDGMDMREFLLGGAEESGRDAVLCIQGNRLQAVKWRQWKAHLFSRTSPAKRVSRRPIAFRLTPPAFVLLARVSAGLGRAEAGPTFADGRHGLGDLGVEGVNFLCLGRARDKHTSVTQGACPPNLLDGSGCGDVGQRVAVDEHEIRALAGGDTPAVGEVEHICRGGGRGGQRLSGRHAAADEQFQLAVQACPEHGAGVRRVGARQDRDARVDQAAYVLLSPGIGRHSLPASCCARGQPPRPCVPQYLGDSRVPGHSGPARFTQDVLDGGQRRADYDPRRGDALSQCLIQLAVHGHMRDDIDASGHDLAHPGHGADVRDHHESATMRCRG